MSALKIKILGWLLHHGNRGWKNEYFYKIKNMLISKYGVPDGADVQSFEGKKCFACYGSGIWQSQYSNYSDFCNNCYSGWYKRPCRVELLRFKIGKYTFHQIGEKWYYKKNVVMPGDIEGFMDKVTSKHCDFARTILFLIYEKDFIKRWWKDAGIGWRMQWWRPSNWAYNIAYLAKHDFKTSIPVENFIKRLWWLWELEPMQLQQFQTKVKVTRLRYHNHIDNDLSF